MVDFDKLTFEEDDIFQRKTFAENLTNLIDKSDELAQNDSYVMALDSSWGTGKTYFVHKWKNMLRGNQKFKVIYYNAWENDDWENALIPLICNISENLEESAELENFRDKGKKLAIILGKHMLGGLIRKISGIEAEKAIEEAAGIISGKRPDDIYTNYKEYSKAKKEFKEQLAFMIPREGKLVIYIDELDRCRPTFAIETLEAVKHFFDVKNIVFIFSLDLLQLSHSISTVYGQGMDATGYLRRFFDTIRKIPEPSIESYVNHISTKYIVEQSSAYETIIKFVKYYALTLRDISVILKNFFAFYVINNYYLASRHKKYEVYLFLFICKYKHPSEFDILLKGKYYIGPLEHISFQDKTIDKSLFEVTKDVSSFINYFANNLLKTSMQVVNPDYDNKILRSKYFEYIDLGAKASNITISQYIQEQLEFYNATEPLQG